MSAFCKAYLKAWLERKVPASVLVEQYLQYKDKPEEEQIRMKEQFAREIEATYPYRDDKKHIKIENTVAEP